MESVQLAGTLPPECAAESFTPALVLNSSVWFGKKKSKSINFLEEETETRQLLSTAIVF